MGCVYFIKHKGVDGIKIGMSSNDHPAKRIESANTYSPNGIELIGFVRNKYSWNLESKLHNIFADKRLNGEWFNISEYDVLNFICNNIPIEDYYQVIYDNSVKFKSKSLDDCISFVFNMVLKIEKQYDTKHYLELSCSDRVHIREDFFDIRYIIIKPNNG